jgi:serine/threonine-protein kinase RsbW
MTPSPPSEPDSIHLSLPSDVACVRPLHAFVQEVAAHGGMEGERANEFALAVEEALVNAIEHGNRGDRRKRVHVEIGCDPREIVVRVTDEGGGFRVEEVPDPTAPENLERTSGRGILFMRAFADGVAFEPVPGRGTSVILRKRFESDGAGGKAAPGEAFDTIEERPDSVSGAARPERKKRRKK